MSARGVLRGASRAFTARVAGAGLAFALGVALTRALGPAGAGVYFFAVTVATIGSVVGRLGLDQLVVRRVAGAFAAGDHGRVLATSRLGLEIAVAGSAAVAVLLFLAAPELEAHVFRLEGLASALRGVSFAVVPLSLVMLRGELLRGLNRTGVSQLVQVALPAAATLLFLALAFSLFGARPAAAAGAYAAGAAASALIAGLLWRRATALLACVEPPGEARELARAALPFLAVSLLALALSWISTLALALDGDDAGIGIFSVAYRTATLTSFVLVAVNAAAAPRFAALVARGELIALGRAARQAMLFTTAFALPFLILAWVFPERIMALFGPGFASGGRALAILATGQFVNVLTGSVGELLLMSGHEKSLRRCLIAATGISVALHTALVPRFGVEGAAAANALTLAALNLGALVCVRRRLSIDVLPFPRFALRRRHA